MANTDDKKYISQINLKETTYHLKDNEARELLNSLASPLLFKGVVSTESEITSLNNYKTGWTYKANKGFTLGSNNIEPGDMIICINSNATYVAKDWTVLQNNIDIMKGASNLLDGVAGLVPAPKIADTDKFLKGNGKWETIDVASALESQELIFDCGTAPVVK